MKLTKDTKRTVQIGDILRFRNGDEETVTNIYQYASGGLAFSLRDKYGRNTYLHPSSALYGCEIVKYWQTRKPVAFYTGGGFYLSAMYISEHYYIVTDNDAFEDGFCVYDDRQDEEQGQFLCQGYLGDKHTWEFDPDDWEDFLKLRKALEEEMGI